MLYDFAYKKRKRLVGEEQLIVDYLQSLMNELSESQPEGVKF